MAIVGPRPTIPAPGRALRRPPAPPPRRPPGDDRLGAGQRPHRDRLGRADRARHLVRRAPLARPRPEDPRPDRLAGRSAVAASTPAGSLLAMARASAGEVTIRPFRPEDAARRPPLVQQSRGDRDADGGPRRVQRGERARAGPTMRSAPRARTASRRSRSRGSPSRSASPPSTASSARPRPSSAR